MGYRDANAIEVLDQFANQRSFASARGRGNDKKRALRHVVLRKQWRTIDKGQDYTWFALLPSWPEPTGTGWLAQCVAIKSLEPHFPIQKLPNISPSRSSALNSPVISPSACCASRRSSARSSPAP